MSMNFSLFYWLLRFVFAVFYERLRCKDKLCQINNLLCLKAGVTVAPAFLLLPKNNIFSAWIEPVLVTSYHQDFAVAGLKPVLNAL